MRANFTEVYYIRFGGVSEERKKPLHQSGVHVQGTEVSEVVLGSIRRYCNDDNAARKRQSHRDRCNSHNPNNDAYWRRLKQSFMDRQKSKRRIRSLYKGI